MMKLKKKMEKNDNDDDRRKKKITIGEFLIQLKRIQHAKAIEGEEEELNRLQLIENYLNEKGLSVYLDHNYFQNIMMMLQINVILINFNNERSK